MADVTVNIPTPVLQGSEKFKTRYRLLPNGAFTPNVDRTSNTFIITGLAVGNYEIEVIFVTEEGTDCPPEYYNFDVLPDFACWDFQSEQIEDNGLYYIKLDFSGGTQPPCGWLITVTPSGGNPQTYTYPTLPVSNTINIAIQNNVIHSVLVVANLCNNNEKECYSINTTPVPTPPICTGATYNDVQLIPPVVPNQLWTLFIDFSQSNPPTVDAQITWQQVGTPVNQGQILDSGSFIQAGYIFGGTPANSTIFLNSLNPIAVWGQTTYGVRFLDRCGNWLTTQVSFG